MHLEPRSISLPLKGRTRTTTLIFPPPVGGMVAVVPLGTEFGPRYELLGVRWEMRRDRGRLVERGIRMVVWACGRCRNVLARLGQAGCGDSGLRDDGPSRHDKPAWATGFASKRLSGAKLASARAASRPIGDCRGAAVPFSRAGIDGASLMSKIQKRAGCTKVLKNIRRCYEGSGVAVCSVVVKSW